MIPSDGPSASFRVGYEQLLSRIERVRLLIPSPAVMANDGGRARLVNELRGIQEALSKAPVFGGKSSARAHRAEIRALSRRIEEVVEKVQEGGNPAKLHRDAAAILESARAFTARAVDFILRAA